MQVDVLVVLLIVVFGCAAFLFGVFYLVGHVVYSIWRGLVNLVRPGRSTRQRVTGKKVERVCPRKGCRKIEYRDARFCSQCGAPLVDQVIET
jgi:hypothetical protein